MTSPLQGGGPQFESGRAHTSLFLYTQNETLKYNYHFRVLTKIFLGNGCLKINNLLIAAFVVVFLIFILLIYLRLRGSPGNNLRRARKHHKLGEKYYREGDVEEANLHYEIAKQYREKALKGGK